jgi:hypothetical protein
MGKIKGPKAHALTIQDRSDHKYQKYKDKYKSKSHANPKKEGYSRPFTDASRSKGEKGRNAYIYIKDSIQNPHVCIKNYI